MCFWESRRTTKEGTLTICLPTLEFRHVSDIHELNTFRIDLPDVTLADEDTRVVDRLGETQFEDLGLKSALQEIFNLESQHVIKTHAGLVKHTNTDKSADKGVTLEQPLGVFWIELKKLTGSTTNFGKDERDPPDLTLVTETVLSSKFQFGIETSGFERTTGDLIAR